MSKKSCRISLDGELTIYSAAAIKVKLMQALKACTDLEIDLSRVSEMDTAGMQLLIAAKRALMAGGGTLSLSGHGPVVVEVMDIFNVAHVFGDAVVIPSGTR